MSAKLKRFIDSELPREELAFFGGPKKTEGFFPFRKTKMGPAHPSRRQNFQPVIPIVLYQALATLLLYLGKVEAETWHSAIEIDRDFGDALFESEPDSHAEKVEKLQSPMEIKDLVIAVAREIRRKWWSLFY